MTRAHIYYFCANCPSLNSVSTKTEVPSDSGFFSRAKTRILITLSEQRRQERNMNTKEKTEKKLQQYTTMKPWNNSSPSSNLSLNENSAGLRNESNSLTKQHPSQKPFLQDYKHCILQSLFCHWQNQCSISIPWYKKVHIQVKIVPNKLKPAASVKNFKRKPDREKKKNLISWILSCS